MRSAYLPHTEEEISVMLKDLGFSALEDLFTDIPSSLRRKADQFELPQAKTEFELSEYFKKLAALNRSGRTSFMGCGMRDHIVPAVVSHICGRSEFFTAYTPYQAEISQGFLQAIFEFQSLICLLSGMEAANASLYDGHTAAAEAAVMALNSKRGRKEVLYSETMHPHTITVLKTFFKALDYRLIEVKMEKGQVCEEDLVKKLSENCAVFLCQSPNFYGCLEKLKSISRHCVQAGALFAVSADPLSLGMLASPALLGADIVFGDLQSLGIQQSFGGPSAGYIACRKKYMRKLPGRIVGKTVDQEGKRAFVLTLQAREQHIKRGKASSNICSNQALMALAATVYLSLLGKQGLVEVANLNYSKAHYLAHHLENQLKIKPVFEAPFFNEFLVDLPINAEDFCQRMADKGILAGIPASRLIEDCAESWLLCAVTEKRSQKELDYYIQKAGEVLA